MNRFFQGMRRAFPVVLGYLAIGFAFGVVARTAGMTVPEIAFMSALLYAGSAQFIGVGMWAAGDGAAAIIFTTALVNLRHLLLSAALAPAFQRIPWWQSILVGFQLTDETFAVASGHLSARRGGEPSHVPWMVGLNLTSQVSWVLATVVGGMFGQVIPDPGALGVDFALAAMFIGLLILHIDSAVKGWVALLAGGLAVVVGHLLPGRWEIIIATVIGATVGLWMEKKS